MNAFELSRKWFDYSFENPEKIKPVHTAIYFFIIDRCNRLGWKEKFGLPTDMAMEALGIKSYNTYKKALFELVDWGFIVMIQKSKNQFTANIIALSKNDKATDKAQYKAIDKALDKAMTMHITKHNESTVQSIVSIDKQLNKQTTKQRGSSSQIFLNLNSDKKEIFEKWLEYRKEIKKEIKVQKTIEGLIKRFNEHSIQDVEKLVSYSIDNNYQGLFWERIETKQKSSFSKNR